MFKFLTIPTLILLAALFIDGETHFMNRFFPIIRRLLVNAWQFFHYIRENGGAAAIMVACVGIVVTRQYFRMIYFYIYLTRYARREKLCSGITFTN